MIINNKMYKRIEKKISLANLSIKPMVFIYIRLFTVIGIFIVLLLSNQYGYIFGPLFAILTYYLFEYICLDRSIIERMEILEKDALEYFPVFLNIFKNGKNIKNALEKTNDIVDNELTKEFNVVLDNVNLGKSLDEALLSVSKRTPSIMVNNIITDLTESNRLGNNIDNSINMQLDLIKEKRNKDLITDLRIIPFRIVILFILFILIVIGLLFFTVLI